MGPTGEYSARLAVAKSRRGRKGFVGLRFHGPSGRFYSDAAALEKMDADGKEEAKRLKIADRILAAVSKSKTRLTRNDLYKKIKGNRPVFLQIIRDMIADEEGQLSEKEITVVGEQGNRRAMVLVLRNGHGPDLDVDPGVDDDTEQNH